MRSALLVLSLSLISLHLANPLPVTTPHHFTLNLENTTGYGAAWTDTFESYVADWVMCEGDYALCFYSNCSTLPTAAPWSGDVPTVSCPCETYKGTYMVMINAILDQHTWEQTRATCPLGLLSCPLPNHAPVCQRINDKTLFTGAEGLDQLSLVSAWSRKNASAHHAGVVLPDLSLCEEGPYAGCMTAPCVTTDAGNTVCECLVAAGPFQVLSLDTLLSVNPADGECVQLLRRVFDRSLGHTQTTRAKESHLAHSARQRTALKCMHLCQTGALRPLRYATKALLRRCRRCSSRTQSTARAGNNLS